MYKLFNQIDDIDIPGTLNMVIHSQLFTSKDQIEGVMLDKKSFTKGDSETFKQWMLEQHPEIEYGPIDPAFDK